MSPSTVSPSADIGPYAVAASGRVLPHGALPHGALPHGAFPHGALPQSTLACTVTVARPLASVGSVDEGEEGAFGIIGPGPGQQLWERAICEDLASADEDQPIAPGCLIHDVAGHQDRASLSCLATEEGP